MGGAKENRLLRKTGRKGKGRRPRRLKTQGERGEGSGERKREKTRKTIEYRERD